MEKFFTIHYSGFEILESLDLDDFQEGLGVFQINRKTEIKERGYSRHDHALLGRSTYMFMRRDRTPPSVKTPAKEPILQ